MERGKSGRGDTIVVSIDKDLKEIIPLYFTNSREEIDALRAYLKREDYENLIRMGHGIKGSSAGYGFAAMGEIGAQIEEAARKKCGLKQIEGMVRILEDYLNRVEVVYV